MSDDRLQNRSSGAAPKSTKILASAQYSVKKSEASINVIYDVIFMISSASKVLSGIGKLRSYGVLRSSQLNTEIIYCCQAPHILSGGAYLPDGKGKYLQMGALKCIAHALIPHCRRPWFSGGVIESDAVS